jgi:anti-sigma-K factor RskA
MMPDAQEHEAINGYLLGTLSQDVQQRIEERLLTEDSFFEELLSAEEELIDDYVSGELSDDVRLKFEQHFLSTPERHEKLRFALALNRSTSTSSEKAVSKSAQEESALEESAEEATGPGWAGRFRDFWNGQSLMLRAAAAVGVVAFIAGAAWFSLLRTSPPQTFATLTLSIGANNRGEGVEQAKVKLPLNADALKISLTLPERLPAAASYRVELLKDDGETEPLKIDGRDAQSVAVVIPATQLKRGQYALRLYTVKPDGTEQRAGGSYLFNVE